MSSGDLIVGRLGMASCRTIRTGVNLKYKRKPLLIYIVLFSIAPNVSGLCGFLAIASKNFQPTTKADTGRNNYKFG